MIAAIGIVVTTVMAAAWIASIAAKKRVCTTQKSDHKPITFAEAPGKPISRHFVETNPRVLVGARPDAGTTIRIEAPKAGWKIGDLGEGQVCEILGKTMEIAPRGPPADDEERTGAVELRARGQARLFLWDHRAELVVGSRALDTLGGIRGWAAEWLTWATEALLGELIDREQALERADEVGWHVVAVDLAAELGGWGPLMAEHQDPDRWTQQTAPQPEPDTQGRLHSLTLGLKSKHPISAYGYDKTGKAERLGRGAAWAERMRQAGLQDGERAWRWELRLRREGLRLRVRGAKGVEVDFTRCASLADQVAIARVWAHVFGNAEADKGGHWRLVVPATRYDDQGRGLPPKRTRAVDPLWRLVQSAGGAAPLETLALVRERKLAARAEWRSRAECKALRGLAGLVALDHEVATASDAALGEATRLLALPAWQDELARQRSASADLRLEEAQS